MKYQWHIFLTTPVEYCAGAKHFSALARAKKVSPLRVQSPVTHYCQKKLNARGFQ